MKKINIKNEMDMELQKIRLSNEMKRRIMDHSGSKKPQFFYKYVALFLLLLVVGGTTVFASRYIMNRMIVNEQTLPELDSMDIVEINKSELEADENGFLNKTYDSYRTIGKELGICLLDTKLSRENPYMKGTVHTDGRDFARIKIDYYIVEDQFTFEEDETVGGMDESIVSSSSISLSVDLILSESQLNHEWDKEYLGMYQYLESYTSAQGYKVNIVGTASEYEESGDNPHKKVAVFVADGVRYSLEGKTSLENMKAIVDSMEYE